MSRHQRAVLHLAVGSDVGLRRERNEDSVYVSPRLLAVADGMGGHAHGEVASAIAVAALAELDRDLPADGDPRGGLLAAVAAIAGTLDEQVRQDEDFAGMGTTLTALLRQGDRFIGAHIGDSRAYLLRSGTLRQLTTDHTWVRSLVAEGRLTEAQIATHPRRSMLMRALQGGGTAQPDIFEWRIRQGDRYLLCSDGLTDYVPTAAVHEVLRAEQDPELAVRGLIDLAVGSGGQDNVTCVVADVGRRARRGWPRR
jgi:protein phosphatase